MRKQIECSKRKTATGCSWGFRAVSSLQQSKRVPENITCMCGHAMPDRRHRLWQCKATAIGAPMPRKATCELEHGLGVPMVTKFPRPPLRRYNIPTGLAEAIRLAAEASVDGIARLATDGSVLEPRNLWHRSGGFGIAVQTTPDNQQLCKQFHGMVGGLDQCSAAAELYGIMVARRAARQSQTPIYIVCDNQAVQRQADAAITGRMVNLPRHYYRQYDELRRLTPAGSRVTWCFSHGKELQEGQHLQLLPNWTETQMRWLNQQSNEAADIQSKAQHLRKRAVLQETKEAHTYASEAMRRLLAAQEAYMELCLVDIKGLEGQEG